MKVYIYIIVAEGRYDMGKLCWAAWRLSLLRANYLNKLDAFPLQLVHPLISSREITLMQVKKFFFSKKSKSGQENVIPRQKKTNLAQN